MKYEHECTIKEVLGDCPWPKTYMEYVTELEAELTCMRRERDAAIADITELAKFYRRRTICDFCKHDSEECGGHHDSNYFINDCFEWRGYYGD